MKRRRLLEEFNLWSQECCAQNLPEYMRKDLRRAFMAGAIGYHKAVVKGLMSQTVITPSDIEMIKDVAMEMADFMKDLQEGRA